MNWLDFSKYENRNSKYTAELSKKGGYVIFSNSGKGNDKKHFTLSLESLLICLNDILKNHTSFIGNEQYEEKKWRELVNLYFTDSAAKAQFGTQTKPSFSTLSKIIIWANSVNPNIFNPEEYIKLDKEYIQKAIDELTSLSNTFTPDSETSLLATTNKENIIYSDKSIRDFAKYVFSYFFKDNWDDLLSVTTQKPSVINEIGFISHDFEFFKRLIGEFVSPQIKENLTSSNTIRYFEEPISVKEGKYYYFSTQWNGEGNYSLSFSNLKKYFEDNFPDYLLKRKNGVYSLIKLDEIPDVAFDTKAFDKSLELSGLNYNKELTTRFLASLLTKPFVILTGLSGSGKTKLAQAFVQWICQDESQYCIVPVGADWTNREPLLGYPNALNPKEYVKPDSGILDLIIQADSKPELPHFIILDEMNLSHVERYFADFLSVMESKEEIPLHASAEMENGVPEKLIIPSNLFIIGTVNIDETTNMFSPKVLDRANTIEFRISEEEMKAFLGNIKPLDMDKLTTEGTGMAKSFLQLSKDKSFNGTENTESVNNELVKFFGELKKTGAEFGYRSASEMLQLMHQLDVLDSSLSADKKLDIMVMQKLLPKLHGSRRKLCPVLETLAGFCVNEDIKIQKDIFENDSFDFNGPQVKYSLSLEKITRMYKNAVDNGYASFAEA
jgi:hypothetical protein